MSDFAVPYTDFRAQNAGVREDLRAAFDGVLDSGQYVQGPNVSAFERDFADYVGAPFATGVANGTCSLHLVLRSMGVGPGDEVITAPNSFFASAARRAASAALQCECEQSVNRDDHRSTLAQHDRLQRPSTVGFTLRPRLAAVALAHRPGSPSTRGSFQLPSRTASRRIRRCLGASALQRLLSTAKDRQIRTERTDIQEEHKGPAFTMNVHTTFASANDEASSCLERARAGGGRLIVEGALDVTLVVGRETGVRVG